MSINTKNNKFVSYLILLLSLFILILVTKDQITVMQENLDLKETANITLNWKKEELENLNVIKYSLVGNSIDVDSYNIEVKEDEIIDYLYSFASNMNKDSTNIVIKSISIPESKDTETWFKETIIELNIIVKNEEKLKEVLTFLTAKDSKYKFFLESLSYPYWEGKQNFGVSIPLRLLHK